jgi:hypothetical protein
MCGHEQQGLQQLWHTVQAWYAASSLSLSVVAL